MKTLLILISFLLIGHTAFPQAYIIDNVHSLYDQFSLEKSRADALGTNRYSNIEGTPYLSETFVKGEVVINDSVRYEMVPLRYNIFTDKMEFLDAQERVLEVNTSMHRFAFQLDDYRFKLVQYNDGTRIQRGLLELMVDGSTRLYRRYKVEIKPGTPQMGYQVATRDKFIRKQDQYLIATENKIPVLVTSRRELIKKLEEDNPELNQYLRKNRLRMSSEQSLIDIIEFANKHTN